MKKEKELAEKQVHEKLIAEISSSFEKSSSEANELSLSPDKFAIVQCPWSFAPPSRV